MVAVLNQFVPRFGALTEREQRDKNLAKLRGMLRAF